MRGEELDEGGKVQGLGGATAAPILQCVPGLRPGQDESRALCVFKVVRVAGGHERPGYFGSVLRMRALRKAQEKKRQQTKLQTATEHRFPLNNSDFPGLKHVAGKVGH